MICCRYIWLSIAPLFFIGGFVEVNCTENKKCNLSGTLNLGVSVDTASARISPALSDFERGVRQVSYFEASGDNLGDSELLSKDTRNSDLGEELKKSGAWVNTNDSSVPSDGWYENSKGVNGDLDKFDIFGDGNDVRGAHNYRFRSERDAEPYDTRELAHSDPTNDSLEAWKWKKKCREVSPVQSYLNNQKMEPYPVNDDVADFAAYMKKNRRNLVMPTIINNYDRNYVSSSNDALAEDVSDHEFHKIDSEFNSRFDNKDYTNMNRPDSGNTKLFKKDLTSKDSTYRVGAIEAGDAQFSACPNRVINHHGIRASSFGEEFGDFLDLNDRDGSRSNLVSDTIVREKPINLPEPLIFNSSHVVSSFVYTMIPFRSPLLNLLENDKHSKYIMIKIDPVLQPTKTANLERQYLTGNIEILLEKNMMNVIDRLIANEMPTDHLSVEGVLRSKQSSRPDMSNRYFRNVNDDCVTEADHSSREEYKRPLGGAIS